MKNNFENEKINISASIPRSLVKSLENIAKQEERSKNFLIKKAIEDLVKQYETKFDFDKELEKFNLEHANILKRLADK